MKTMLPRWFAFGLSTLLLTLSVRAGGLNPIPYEETFESYSNGYSMLYNDSIAGLPPRDNGWSLGNSNDVASVSNYTFSYVAPGYPYLAGTQTNALYFETATGSKGISNSFNTYPATNVFSVDMMLRPGQMDPEESPLVKNVTNNCHLAMFVDTNGFINLYHTYFELDPPYDESLLWTRLTHTPIGSDEWVRITIEFDFSQGSSLFQIRINNAVPLTDSTAYNRGFTETNGTWFFAADHSRSRISGFSLGGMGMVDDIRIRPGESGEATTYSITPTVDSPGSISPSNKVFLTGGGSADVTVSAPLYWYIQDITTNSESVGGAFGTGVTNYTHTIAAITNDVEIHGTIWPELAANNTPLWWLASHNLFDFNNDATNDADGDGSPTWQEYQLGTDPTNQFSVRYLITPSVSGNGTIDPATNLYVWGFREDSPVFTITADPNYIVQDILTNGVSIGATLGVQSINYTWANVSSSGSIYAVISAGFPPPANVAASDGTFTGKVYITWDNSIGATNYMVYRDTGSNPALAPQIGQATNTFFDDTNAAAGVLYYYWIKASNEVFISGFSASDTGYLGLPAPTNVAATDGTFTNKVTVSWAAQADATGYEVWKNTSNDISTASRIIVTTATTADDSTNAVSGIQYWYWVRGTNAVATSGYSLPDTGWVNLMAPAWITASDAAFTDKIEVVWMPAVSASGYEVWRNITNVTGSATRVGTSATTNYSDRSAGLGTNYYYWVKATNSLGTSDFSGFDIGTLKSLVIYILIQPSVDANGTIDPATNILVTQGATANFLITALNYYHVSGVVTDGAPVAGTFGGDSYNFAFSNIVAGGTCTVHGLIAATVTTNNHTPYYWLAEYGLTNSGLTFEQAATNDFDNDGLSAGDEYIAGTDPTNRLSSFKIIFRGVQNGSNVVKWLGGTSGGAMTNPYQVLVRTNLTSGTWDGTGAVNRVEFTNTWMDKAPTNSRVFFYRIKATD